MVSVPKAFGETVARSSTAAVTPAGRTPSESAPVHGCQTAPPSSEYSAPESAAGRLSVKRTFCASPGPRLAASSV